MLGYFFFDLVILLSDKPALEDLQYFLEFQVPRQWAPMFCELPLRHQRRNLSCPTLQFRFMGSKMHVSSTQVPLVPITILNTDKPIYPNSQYAPNCICV